VQAEVPTTAMQNLNNDLNNFVVKMAISQAEAVDPGFLIKYIHRVGQYKDAKFILP
jgi:hypothetical protein